MEIMIQIRSQFVNASNIHRVQSKMIEKSKQKQYHILLLTNSPITAMRREQRRKIHPVELETNIRFQCEQKDTGAITAQIDIHLHR